MYYNVKEGHEAEFEGMFAKVVDALKSADVGMVDAKLYREVGRREYMIYTEWDGIGSFRGFVQSKEFRDTVGRGSSIIEGRPRHRLFADLPNE
jgi:heme-degrading monooxygenase HmoA